MQTEMAAFWETNIKIEKLGTLYLEVWLCASMMPIAQRQSKADHVLLSIHLQSISSMM